MTIEKWVHRDHEEIADLGIFRLTRTVAASPRTGRDRSVARIETDDWVNVIALTEAGEVVLIEQYRHGTDEITLEIPGGIVDPGEAPRDAAVRELREETGYTGGRVSDLGVVEPNPAFLDNRCHTFLVEGCRQTHEQSMDEGEDIDVHVLPLSEIPAVIASGRIAHSLVICGFWWLALRRDDLLQLS